MNRPSPSICHVIALVSAFVAALAFVVPWAPLFPEDHLDSSWQYGLNEAVASGLQFGRDIVFTFGPYASVYSTQYHPDTHMLMMMGAIYLALAFGVGAGLLAHHKPFFSLSIMLILPLLANYGPILATVSRDAFFLSYPLLPVILGGRLALSPGHPLGIRLTPWATVCLASVAAALGLLSLIKGTFALYAALSAVLTGLILLPEHRFAALLVLVAYVTALIGFWAAAGQPLAGLPVFFSSLGPILSGYSEAMSVPGKTREIWLFLLYSLILLGSVAVAVRRTHSGYRAILILLAVTAGLSLVFKAGFVRHDMHALICGGAALLIAYICGLQMRNLTACMMIASALVVWSEIDRTHTPQPLRDPLFRISSFYHNAWQGISSRLANSDWPRNTFEAKLSQIRSGSPLQSIAGSTDVYSYGQAVLLAHGLRWNPRPVIQSLAAYTPALAKMNADHIRADNAPDNLLFSVQAIDNRLPALEDGLSWPLIYTRYQAVSFDGKYLLLRKAAKRRLIAAERSVLNGSFRIEEDIEIPASGILWAELDLRPTLAGRLAGLVFKPPDLAISLELADGQTLAYRYIAAMGRAGFLLSPLIENTADFSALSGLQLSERPREKRVVRLRIHGEKGSQLFWQNEFALRIKSLRLENQTPGAPTIPSPGNLSPT